MSSFEPSADFVARVMHRVRIHEAAQVKPWWAISRSLESKPLRLAVSWCGLLFGIFLSPAVCL